MKQWNFKQDMTPKERSIIIKTLKAIRKRTFLFKFMSENGTVVALGVSMPKYGMEFTLEYN